VRALLPREVRRGQVAPEEPDVPALPRRALAAAAAGDATAGMPADAIATAIPLVSASLSQCLIVRILQSTERHRTELLSLQVKIHREFATGDGARNKSGFVASKKILYSFRKKNVIFSRWLQRKFC
jgi:hypothetical protein